MLFDRKRKSGDGDGEAALEPHLKSQRNRMAGMWAAELLGLIGQAAHDYAHDVVHSHESSHDDDEPVIRRLAHDLKGKVSAHEVREKLAHLLHEARRQLKHQAKDPE
ncbi:ATPase inhibitor subunit zeta [Magnetospirillum sp. UT-4]|uniref:ATPase inhibitor subunit zeta n=1 Tax=Magnetospirillum sp. UT-4 TaxID=2681467 RepID=UPI001383254A|nr:ATPase inhibitor subunit zeta [Magnetospirillum sp. UT-4]CAA7613434.1 conserved hypothetical protein [Magnetospirillum sp. UT-4]